MPLFSVHTVIELVQLLQSNVTLLSYRHAEYSVTSILVEVESGALLCDVERSWKLSLEVMESHGKVMENF